MGATGTPASGLIDELVRRGWSPPPVVDGVYRPAGTTDPAAVSYPGSGIDVLASHAEGSWWTAHRAAWAARELADHGIRSLLDVGAGSGSMAVALRAGGVDVVGVEPHPHGAAAIAAAGVAAVCGGLADLALPDGSVPAIGFFDVLEHLPDPVDVLREAARVLRPDGVVLLAVPAYRWLWSSEDEHAGHFRRYDRAMVRAEARAAGLLVVRTEHLFASLVPLVTAARRVPYLLGRRPDPAAVDRTVGRQLDPPAVLARAAGMVLGIENRIARVAPLPVGTSLVAVLRRPSR
ncbi:MAG: class I SAM-dependent methyltransferase [Actinobacteria bacterium]|nr:class I SAM-dependent methyltransferase [Actinomycetota bacterium]